jgi:hypothetical protein
VADEFDHVLARCVNLFELLVLEVAKLLILQELVIDLDCLVIHLRLQTLQKLDHPRVPELSTDHSLMFLKHGKCGAEELLETVLAAKL